MRINEICKSVFSVFGWSGKLKRPYNLARVFCWPMACHSYMYGNWLYGVLCLEKGAYRLFVLYQFSLFGQRPRVLEICYWYHWNSKIQFSGQKFWVAERRVKTDKIVGLRIVFSLDLKLCHSGDWLWT